MADDPVLEYDGDSAFCRSVVRWLERYPRASLSSAGWEAVPSGPDTLRWITPAGQVYTGSQALARLLLRTGGIWAYGGALLTLAPIRPLADAVYRVVARNRTRRPGGTPADAATGRRS